MSKYPSLATSLPIFVNILFGIEIFVSSSISANCDAAIADSLNISLYLIISTISLHIWDLSSTPLSSASNFPKPMSRSA
ncbi:MAG: hypothetical protein ACP5I6_05750, partial [Caldisphaera sp.]